MDYLKFLFFGILGGTVSGFLGIGGGVIIIPLILYFTKLDIKAATAISMVQIFFASFFGTVFNYKYKIIIIKLSLLFGLLSMIFSFFGGFVTKYIPDLAIKIIYLFAVIISLILFYLRGRLESNIKEIPKIEKTNLYKLILVSIFAGFIAGLLGIGGGIIFVPALLYFFKLPIKIAVATSLGAIVITSIPAIIGKVISVDFNILIGVLIGIGAIGGSRIGTYINKKINPLVTKVIFTILLISIIIRVLFDILN